jgi:hypothetical protein
MYKLKNLIIVVFVILAFATLATCSYAEDKSPVAKQDQATASKAPEKKSPTEKDLLLQQRETVLERMEKLDAQYNLAHTQYILAEQDLDRINARLNGIIAAEKKEQEKK